MGKINFKKLEKIALSTNPYFKASFAHSYNTFFLVFFKAKEQ